MSNFLKLVLILLGVYILYILACVMVGCILSIKWKIYTDRLRDMGFLIEEDTERSFTVRLYDEELSIFIENDYVRVVSTSSSFLDSILKYLDKDEAMETDRILFYKIKRIIREYHKDRRSKNGF